MSTPSFVDSIFSRDPVDLSGLLEAVRTNPHDDTLARFMDEADWIVIAPYLYSQTIGRGHILTARGALDRTLYFVESGTLVVHYANADKSVVIANIHPGAVVGEGAFFAQIERNATVQAASAAKVWALTPAKFEKLRKRETLTALKLAMALGAVVSSRMLDVTRRVAVT